MLCFWTASSVPVPDLLELACSTSSGGLYKDVQETPL